MPYFSCRAEGLISTRPSACPILNMETGSTEFVCTIKSVAVTRGGTSTYLLSGKYSSTSVSSEACFVGGDLMVCRLVSDVNQDCRSASIDFAGYAELMNM